MAIASFLQPVTRLTPPLAADDTAGAIAPPSRELTGFGIAPQEQINWCWAAVSASIANYFGSALWTQCDVATRHTGYNCCLGQNAGDPNTCNVYGYLDKALSIVGHFRDKRPAAASFSDVQTEINNGLPLGCRIAWAGGGAHFVALGGWLIADGIQYVSIHDPIYRFVQKPYAQFVNSYRQSGDTWTTNYRVRNSVQMAAAGEGDA